MDLEVPRSSRGGGTIRRLRRLTPCDQKSLEISRNFAEHYIQLPGDRLHRGDDGDAYERREQRIFDCSRAAFIVEKFPKYGRHQSLPLRKFAPCRRIDFPEGEQK